MESSQGWSKKSPPKKKILLLQVQLPNPVSICCTRDKNPPFFGAISEIHVFPSLFRNNFAAAVAAPCRRQKNLTNERSQFQLSKGQVLETSTRQKQLNHKKNLCEELNFGAGELNFGMGSWILGPRSWILGLGRWISGLGRQERLSAHIGVCRGDPCGTFQMWNCGNSELKYSCTTWTSRGMAWPPPLSQ